MTMIFEFDGQRYIPQLPRRGSKVLVPDGVTFFSAEQVAQRTGETVDEARARWVAAWAPYLDPTDLAEPSAASTNAVLTEEAGPRPEDPIAAGTQRLREDIIWLVRFPHVTDENHRLYVQDDCRQRGLDLREIWIKVERNPETRQLEPKIITTLAAFRRIARRTGMLKGETLPQCAGPDGEYKEVWPDDAKPPYVARAGVFRRDSDDPYEGQAYWRFHAQYYPAPADAETPTPTLDSFWQRGGPQMLGKCALALAYRAAFDQLAGLYTSDEISPKSDDRRRGRRSASRSADVFNPDSGEVVATIADPVSQALELTALPDDPVAAWDLIDETTPDSPRSLLLALLDLNIGGTAQCQATIDRLKPRYPRLSGNHYKAFCAVVLKLVKDNPGAYGAI